MPPLVVYRAIGAMRKKRVVRREGVGELLRLQAINDLPVLECVGAGRPTKMTWLVDIWCNKSLPDLAQHNLLKT